MPEFGSLAAFGAHLAGLVVKVEHIRHEALEEAAKIVEVEAKRVLGTHDYGWPPLKPSTIARKVTGDSPLLETGAMRKSITHQVMSRSEAQVGTNDQNAVYNEMGTSKAPPRPFLMGAAIRKEAEVRQLLGLKTVGVLLKP